jgi:hypothetical protein
MTTPSSAPGSRVSSRVRMFPGAKSRPLIGLTLFRQPVKFVPLIIGFVFLALGALIAWVNFYTSFIRYPLHRLRGGTRETFRWVSGYPIVGFLFLCVAAACFSGRPALVWTTVAIALFDTSGPHWLLVGLIYMLIFKRRGTGNNPTFL